MTTGPAQVRKLAAIVIADVVGYSRQMGEDETGTIERVRALRTEILDPAMQEHGGRIVKLMGDGILAEFASAVAATRWAVDVQHAIAARNASGDSSPILLRIGVNVGDIILEDGDVFGDGVNVAARLEPLAPKGGICISSSAHEHVCGKVGVEFASRGERALKNIARPVAIWCWSPDGLEEEPAPAPASSEVVLRPPARKPTLSVRPLEVMGASADASTLSAAVHDATLVSLSNLSGLTLLATEAGADYSASGTLQASGQRYRATVRLVDNRSGEQFWSERFDGELAELFDAQDELAFRISTSLRFSVYDREVAEIERLPEADRTLEMLFAKLGQTMAGGRVDEWADAGPRLDALLAANPNESGAWGMKASWHLFEVFYGWRPLAEADRAGAIAAARSALRSNERSDFAHLTMAIVHLYAENDTERALREARRSLELNPYYAIARYGLGLSMIFGGNAEAGLEHCVSAANASARNVIYHRMAQGAAIGCFVLGRHDDAVDYAQRSDHQRHDVLPTLLVMAAAAAEGGLDDDAASTCDRIVLAAPDFRIAGMRRWPFRSASDHERFVAALAKAGLPG